MWFPDSTQLQKCISNQFKPLFTISITKHISQNHFCLKYLNENAYVNNK